VASTDTELAAVVNMPIAALVSEEDVKNKVVIPLLRAFGYLDGEFGYERRTGRGYVDVALDHHPVAIVVETKAPRSRLDDHVEQLESYVFHKHSHDREATVAILTDGDWFRIYGVTDALRKGSLSKHQLMMPFHRSSLIDPNIALKLRRLLGREQNQAGEIPNAIKSCHEDMRAMQDKLLRIDMELTSLRSERQRIEDRIHELERERASVTGTKLTDAVSRSVPDVSGLPEGSAVDHVVRLLGERGAMSRATAVNRDWLDQQLIGRVQAVRTQQAVSFALIQAKKAGQIDYEERRGKKHAWLR
jgi:hypothetical protein